MDGQTDGEYNVPKVKDSYLADGITMGLIIIIPAIWWIRTRDWKRRLQEEEEEKPK